MLYLLSVSIIWAFSFALIGNILKGHDPYLIASIRLALSFVLFLPSFIHACKKKQSLPVAQLLLLGLIGAIQYGVMYVCLFKSYEHIQSHEVALFTILTPLYATLINDLLTRKFHPLFLITAIVAVAGCAVIKWTELKTDNSLWLGFGIMQISNLSFAFGQIAYRNLMRRHSDVSDHAVFAPMYLGAVAVAIGFAFYSGSDWQSLSKLDAKQWSVLVYLGIVASGLCFFMWNAGARRCDAGAVAIFNNLKIPMAVSVSLIFFAEKTDITRLIIGGSITIAALAFNELFLKKDPE